jgi:MFS transporter, DHA1 family, inner membrane transport protein
VIPPALLALAVASFGIGTTEFVIMGLLPDVARDLRVGIPAAGLLVSGYAIGVAVGAPLVAAATARLPRKTALLALMGVFILGNMGCALAPDYTWLMVARVLTAFAHGSFFGIGAVVAAELVPARRAQAMAVMFAGLTIANVLGVPFGTLFGQALGWRATFWAVVAIGVVAAALLAVLLPSGVAGAGGGLLREVRALGRRQVGLAMLTSTLSSVSLFSVFTYITPLLEMRAGMSPRAVSWALLLFGVGLTVGNLLGGRLADRRLRPALAGGLALVTLVLGLFTVTSDAPSTAVATMLVWGVVVFALVAPLQIWVVDAASGAPNLASILNQGAFNLGNATGAWLGGAAISAGLGYAALPPIGAGVAAVALALTLVGGPRESPGHDGAPGRPGSTPGKPCLQG